MAKLCDGCPANYQCKGEVIGIASEPADYYSAGMRIPILKSYLYDAFKGASYHLVHDPSVGLKDFEELIDACDDPSEATKRRFLGLGSEVCIVECPALDGYLV